MVGVQRGAGTTNAVELAAQAIVTASFSRRDADFIASHTQSRELSGTIKRHVILAARLPFARS